ncbi:MAG: hypothetical protein ACUVV4_00275 [Candidatus Bathyarchaeia archaeon]
MKSLRRKLSFGRSTLSEGYNVDTTTSGSIPLETMKHPHVLVIVDVTLPGMRGIAWLKI